MPKRKRSSFTASSSTTDAKTITITQHNDNMIEIPSAPPPSTKPLSVKSKSKSVSKFNRIYSMKHAVKSSTKIPVYTMPKVKFENALQLLENDSLFAQSSIPYWKLSCTPAVHEIDTRKREMTKNALAKLLREARKSVLQQDWINLAKILCLVQPTDENSFETYFETFKKYAEICLLHNPDEELINHLKQTVLAKNKNVDENDKEFYRMTSLEENVETDIDNDDDDDNNDDNAGTKMKMNDNNENTEDDDDSKEEIELTDDESDYDVELDYEIEDGNVKNDEESDEIESDDMDDDDNNKSND